MRTVRTWTISFPIIAGLCNAVEAIPHQQRIEYGTLVIQPSYAPNGFEEFSIQASMPCANCEITNARVQVLDAERQQGSTGDVLFDHIVFCNGANQEGDRCRGEELSTIARSEANGAVAELRTRARDETTSDLQEPRPPIVTSSHGHSIFILTGRLQSASPESKHATLSITWTFDSDRASESTPSRAPAIYKSASVRYRRMGTPAEPQQSGTPIVLHDDIERWVLNLLVVALIVASFAIALASKLDRRQARQECKI